MKIKAGDWVELDGFAFVGPDSSSLYSGPAYVIHVEELRKGDSGFWDAGDTRIDFLLKDGCRRSRVVPCEALETGRVRSPFSSSGYDTWWTWL